MVVKNGKILQIGEAGSGRRKKGIETGVCSGKRKIDT